jgi:hypothetical protein
MRMHTAPEPQAAGQPAAPQPPAPAPPPTVTVPTPQVIVQTQAGGAVVGRVLSGDQIEALRDQRSELSNQLISATNRRDEFAKELLTATGANREGLEARVKLLDQRILQIEGEIASTGQLLASSLAQNPTPDIPFGNMRPDITAIAIVFTIFVMAPLALAVTRMIWKRASSPRAANPQLERENSERLQRLESAVDAIAIEMERVSEGQRFVTKLLAESAQRVQVGAPRE